MLALSRLKLEHWQIPEHYSDIIVGETLSFSAPARPTETSSQDTSFPDATQVEFPEPPGRPVTPVNLDVDEAPFLPVKDSSDVCGLSLPLQAQLLAWAYEKGVQDAQKTVKHGNKNVRIKTAWPEEVKLLCLQAWDECGGKGRAVKELSKIQRKDKRGKIQQKDKKNNNKKNLWPTFAVFFDEDQMYEHITPCALLKILDK